MTDTPNTIIEITKILTTFLSENSISILILCLLFICRDSIHSFISRLTSLSIKNGDSELGMSAVAPLNEEKTKNTDFIDADEKPIVQNEKSKITNENNKDAWFSEMYSAFNNGQLDTAELLYKKYSLEEKDEGKLEEFKATYLFFRFTKGMDNSAIGALEELVRTAKTEKSKFNTITWLSFCLSNGMQYKAEVELWEKAATELKSQPLVSRAVVNLAYALNKDNKPAKARELLVGHLQKIEDTEQKSIIFEALSIVEASLGNKVISIYCKDKSLEFDPHNRVELFNSAYSASNLDIDDISLGNYLRLLKIDNKNPTALNNLGVRAQEAGLKINAVENYKKSSTHKNTLAMANQGYLLLDAGFTDEAEQIAEKALALENVHQNVYSLITAINEKKKEQKEQWEKLCEKSLHRQKMIRSYIGQYYLGNSKNLEGEWFVNGIFSMNIAVTDDKFEACWEEHHSTVDGIRYTASLTGSASGSSISGQYSRKLNGDRPIGLLGLAGNSSNTFIGFISDEGDNLTLIGPKIKDDFTLYLTRAKTK